ncbi:hypothetical protein D9M69_568340 [compost metagenome]
MADVQRGLGRQREQPPHRAVELARVAARKVGAGAAQVGHEERVADEDRVVDEVRHVGRRVAGHAQGLRLDLADVKAFAVLEQVVELAAVGQEVAFQVVEAAEGGLHRADVLADGDAPAGL